SCCSPHIRALHSFPTRRSSDLYHRDLRLLKRRLTFKGVDHIISRAERKIYPIAYGGGHGDIYHQPDELLNDLLEAREALISQHKDRKSTRLNSSHVKISYAVFC